MKMLIIGDQHLADRPPSSRKDTYRQDILDKLVWIVEYANSMKVDLILNLGDVFHIKRSDRNSHFLVQEVARIFGASKAPVLIVPGNHDLAAGYRLLLLSLSERWHFTPTSISLWVPPISSLSTAFHL